MRRGADPIGSRPDVMATDLTVILEDRPGELARLGETTGDAGVNLLGMCALTGEGKGFVHVLVDDEQAALARAALEGAGMGVADAREALVIDIRDRPGTLGEVARTLAEASVNIEPRLHDVRRREARGRHRRPRLRARRARLSGELRCERGLTRAGPDAYGVSPRSARICFASSPRAAVASPIPAPVCCM